MRHTALVADVHDDVEQLPTLSAPPISRPTLAVGSPTPKLSPDTVTEAYPLNGAFRRASETTAPSKLNHPVSVPTMALTLTVVLTVEPLQARRAHATVVADVHADVAHTSAVASEIVAVGLEVPKLSPLIVTVPLPLDTALAAAALTTGAA